MDEFERATTLLEQARADLVLASRSLARAEISKTLKRALEASSSLTRAISSLSSMQSPGSPTAWGPKSGISSPTPPISTQLSPETFIQLWLSYAGQIWGGPATLQQIVVLPTETSTDITLTVSCARSSGTAQTTEDSPPPSPPKPSSRSKRSSSSSHDISLRFQHIDSGTVGLVLGSEDLDFLLALAAENDGSLEDIMIQLPTGKLSHLTLKVPSLI